MSLVTALSQGRIALGKLGVKEGTLFQASVSDNGIITLVPCTVVPVTEQVEETQDTIHIDAKTFELAAERLCSRYPDLVENFTLRLEKIRRDHSVYCTLSLPIYQALFTVCDVETPPMPPAYGAAVRFYWMSLSNGDIVVARSVGGSLPTRH